MMLAKGHPNEKNMRSLKNLLLALAFAPLTLAAQERYMTRTGHIEFQSDTPMEKIEAVNDKVTSVWDATTGAIEFAALVKAFAFEKALMQEHFNENYMESNTYPKASFKGKLGGISAEQIKTPGTYPVTVEGALTIHGVEKPMKSTGTVVVDAKGLHASSEFVIKPEDHGIKIPGMVRKNIAEQIQVKVRMDYQKM